MALQSTGPDVDLVRGPTGLRFDWNMSTSGPNKGNPVLTNNRLHSVMTTLFSHKRGRRPGDKSASGGYYWDTAGRRGTLLWTVTQDRSATRSQLIAAAQDGLQQLVDERLIPSFLSPDATRRRPGGWAMTVPWNLPSGDRKEIVNV